MTLMRIDFHDYRFPLMHERAFAQTDWLLKFELYRHTHTQHRAPPGRSPSQLPRDIAERSRFPTADVRMAFWGKSVPS